MHIIRICVRLEEVKIEVILVVSFWSLFYNVTALGNKLYVEHFPYQCNMKGINFNRQYKWHDKAVKIWTGGTKNVARLNIATFCIWEMNCSMTHFVKVFGISKVIIFMNLLSGASLIQCKMTLAVDLEEQNP